MKKLLASTVALVCLCIPAFSQIHPYQVRAALQSGLAAPASTTWFVRKDGGTRFSTNQTQGQCDGQADAPYPGVGINQHCAFNDVRYLWTDGTYSTNTTAAPPAWGWVGTGGDTYFIRGGPWRVGQNGPNESDSFGLYGDPYDAAAPPPPNGTSSQHTQILGENFANCGSQSSMTQLFGGFGVNFVFNLHGSQNVDIKCIELTRHSQCIKYGTPAVPAVCNTGFPGIDDTATNGILTDTGTHDVLLQDMWIHGFTARGIIGPIGGTITATRVDIAYNGEAGWDFDDGNATPSVNGLLVANGLVVEWNGCNQAYPGTGAVSCYSQSTGGYGDGIGTPSGTCISTNVTNSIFRYNTQDGYDWLHNDTGVCPSSVTNSMSYGNNGSQFKWGPANNPMVFTNNVAVGNCLRLSAPMTGQPSTYNANLKDFCRALDTIVPSVGPNGSLVMKNNTIISYSPTIIDLECGPAGCANSSFTFQNNIVLGYDNPATYALGGVVGGPGALYYNGYIGSTVRSNNIYFGVGHGFTPMATEQVVDPNFVGEPRVFTAESDLDVFSTVPVLPSGSALTGLGAAITGVAATLPPPVVTPPPVTTPSDTPPPATPPSPFPTSSTDTPPPAPPPSPFPSQSTDTPPPAVQPPSPFPSSLMADAVKICDEGCTITFLSADNAVLQFGTGGTWGPSFTTNSLPFAVNYVSPPNLALSPAGDPAPNIAKEIDAQRQSSDYSVTWILNGVTTITPVPGLGSV
jgi:hypothetical protein